MATQAKSVQIFVDGASRGNPGPASIGAVLKDESGEILKTLSKKIGQTTNNVAEYMALILALQTALANGYKVVSVSSDSELMVKQMQGEYKVKDASLKILFFIAAHLKQSFKSFSINHVMRELNKEADKLANEALDDEALI